MSDEQNEATEGSESELSDLLCANFSLERLVAARKMRTHCKKFSHDELIDEIVGLYSKYYLPDIEKMQELLRT